MASMWLHGRNRELQRVVMLASFIIAAMFLTGFANAATMAAGASHSVVLKDDGTVWAWGSNAAGQLGSGTLVNSPTPVQVSGLAGVSAVAAGDSHSVALKNDGTVWAWGYNALGQLGNGAATNSSTPVQVSGMTSVAAIAAGQYLTVAMKSDGTVWTWGANNLGQLGYASTASCAAHNAYPCALTAAQVSGISGVIAIAAGEAHVLALKSNGTVWAWGANLNGQLGNGALSLSSAVPAQVALLTGITALANGSAMNHGLALKSDGTVWSWGYNGFGQLGNGTSVDASSPAQVGGLTGITAIAGGKNHSLALKNADTVWAWGEGSQGALGSGAGTQSSVPVQATGLSGIMSIAAGGYHGLARRSDGSLWAWGRNDAGQLGNGGTSNASTAAAVKGAGGSGTLSLQAAGYSGIFYNAAESGWGISITHHATPGNIIFAVWYVYDSSGAPAWYVMSNCPLGGSSTCTGNVYKTTGTPLGQVWDASRLTIVSAGSGTLSFADQNNVSFSYTVDGVTGVKSLSRQVFAAGNSLPASDYTDLWYNPAESGWGVSITQQYGMAFIGWYTYDANGKPKWYVASACVMASDYKSCAGDLYQTTGTYFGSGWNSASHGVNKVGSIGIAFSDASTAVLTGIVNGVSITRSIVRQQF